MMSQSIFEKIAAKQIPAYIVWENTSHMAFLDINPLAPGHTLVVPKENIGDYIFGLDNNNYHELMRAAKEVAELIERKLDVDRMLVLVEGFEVPHVHIHLIPVSQGKGFKQLRQQPATEKDLKKIHQTLTASLKSS